MVEGKPGKWTAWLLAAIILAHVGFAISYARETPYRTGGYIARQRDRNNPAQHAHVPEIGAPDERQHANYIQHLLDGRGIPYLQVNVPDAEHPAKSVRNPELEENYEGHQPPVYYLIAAGWAKMLGRTNVEDRETGLRLRYLNTLFGALTVAGVFFLALWGFGGREVGLVAASIAALLPMNLALSGAISNDPLLIAICTWSLALYAKGIMQGWSTKLALLAGLLAGIGIWTKNSALPLLLFLPLSLFLTKPAAKSIWIAALAPAFGLAIAWWLRTVLVYQPQGYGFDPLGLNVFQDAFKDAAPASAFIAGWGPKGYWIDMVAWWGAQSFFGVFGIMDIFLSPQTYRILLALALTLILGWFFRARKPDWKQYSKVQTMCLLFLAVTILLFIKFNTMYFQAQGRYLYPAIGVFACGFAVGALFFARGRWIVSLGVLSVGLIGLNLYILQTLLPQEFLRRIG